MNSGLFISDEIITLVTTSKNGGIKFNGFDGDTEIPLFFLFDKDKNPPIELSRDAKSLYYPGNPEILGDILKYTDTKNDSLEIYGQEFVSIEILNKLILKLLSDHKGELNKNGGSPDDSNFLLIVPPYINEDLQNNLIQTIPEEFKPVKIINYSIPYIHSLLVEKKLPPKGNVLYIEMGYSDIYFQLLSTTFVKNNHEITVKKEDRNSDTKLVFRTIQMIAEEIVDLAFHEFGFAANNEILIKENEIQHLIPDAQDIISELNNVDDWNSIEVEIELSDGTSGSVVIVRDKLRKKFAEIVESEGLESKIDQLLKKLKPKNIVLVGESLNNRFLLDFFNTYQECGKIVCQADYYQKICNIIFENIGDVEEKATLKNEALELVDPKHSTVEVVKDKIIPAEVYEVEPFVEKKTIRKKKGVLIKILIPVLIVIAAFLIYKFAPILSYKVNPENITFSSKAGDIQLLKISSSGEWQINDVPEWLKLEILTASGTEEILVWTADENSTNDKKTATIHVLFGYNISKSIEIVQLGANNEIEKTIIENDSISSIKKHTETGNWNFNDLNRYIEGIRGSSDKVDFSEVFKNIDPNCEVYYYINGDKISSEDITTFINKVKFGGTEKLVPNSLKYNPQGKLIEFGQE